MRIFIKNQTEFKKLHIPDEVDELFFFKDEKGNISFGYFDYDIHREFRYDIILDSDYDNHFAIRNTSGKMVTDIIIEDEFLLSNIMYDINFQLHIEKQILKEKFISLYLAYDYIISKFILEIFYIDNNKTNSKEMFFDIKKYK